ncbi:MAG: SDR family oxidoreductase [Alphaproteobacteria bacterium]|nr:SDR family oxidoreductase [Alphaproteobacteria bacterium]
MKRRFDHVLITGGAGYVGSLLTPALLAEGYRVTVFDIMFFGDDFLPKDHPNLRVIKGDIRDLPALERALEGVDAVINLACISNDASFELDEALSESINYHAFEPMVIAAKAAGVRRFIYASSSSVYGVSEAAEVTEDHPLVPLTLYNKYKGLCEPLLFKHQSPDFICVTIRPATLCGYAPRQRLDLTVNILTNHAVNNGKITVFGGTQLRPNLHVKDMVALYLLLLTVEDGRIAGETFNCGYQNQSVAEIARKVKSTVEETQADAGDIGVVTTPSDDLRSYHISSKKIEQALGFVPEHSIEEAVADLSDAFSSGLLPDSLEDDRYFNVKRLKAIQAR